MNIDRIEKIANAILYEGYLLYPYRASAVKNRHRWTFGALYPPSYSNLQSGNDPCSMQTECLLKGSQESTLNIKLRFLQLISRESGAQAWQEAEEKTFEIPETKIGALLSSDSRFPFEFQSMRKTEESVTFRREEIHGAVEIKAECLKDDVYKITLRILNVTDFEDAKQKGRDEALMRSLVSTHCILNTRDGEFVSLLDPPEELKTFAKECNNVRNWPVLVGNEGERTTMLASPIILYDYPQVAEESAGDLFDSTEIDEILSLRILTLTEEEKAEMRQVDERARKLLERTESIPAEQFLKMHGAVRGLKRVVQEPDPKEEAVDDANWNPYENKPPLESVVVLGVEVKKGSRVRLWPVKSADIMDLALSGRSAIVEAIEEDYDGRVHLAVIIEDDPGKDMGELRQPGHRFFFTPEEVEPL
ncbi:hypothetical protein L0152_29875 [bacterium]|nr:hypothetical protein [bacterium]